jgi:hypothetical protein
LPDAVWGREVIDQNGDFGAMRDGDGERGVGPARKPESAAFEDEPEASEDRTPEGLTDAT